MPSWQTIRDWILRWARYFNEIWVQLKLTRISLLAVSLGIWILSLDQGRDIVQGLVDSANEYIRQNHAWSTLALLVYFQWFAFILACLWSGFCAWYWPRLLARITPKPPRPFVDLTFNLFTFFLGLAPLVAAICTIWNLAQKTTKSPLQDVWIGLMAFGLTLLGWGMVLFRASDLPDGWLPSRWRRKPVVSTPPKSSILLAWIRRSWKRPPDRDLTFGDDIFFVVSYVLSLIAALAFMVSGLRTDLAWLIGPAALAFAAVGFIIGGISGFAWFIGKLRFPVLWFVVLAFSLMSLIGDNHAVRRLSDDAPSERINMAGAIKQWSTVNPNGPVVLIAAAGGASRAGYWTGTVLRALDDATNGKFGQHVFAISSVSGGSLGAVAYAAWSAEQADHNCSYDPVARKSFDRDFLGRDYLSPAVAGMLYTDLLHAFFAYSRIPDRASSLEEGFEAGWSLASKEPKAKTCLSSSRMSEDYLDIWRNSFGKDARWIPLVLVNGTMVENGKRVITAPVQIDPAIFEDSYDFYELLPHPVRASTAISNGARFPIISPAGTLRGVEGVHGRIVDGGYYESGGLDTLYDLTRFVQRELPDRQIILIEIANNVPTNQEADDRHDLRRHPNIANGQGLPVQEHPNNGASFLSGISSIVGGLYATGSARGVVLAKRLSSLDRVGLSSNVSRVTFNLPRLGERGTTMSWVLSKESRDHMDEAFASGPAKRNADLDCEITAVSAIASLINGNKSSAPPNCKGPISPANVGVPLRPLP